MDRFNVLVQEEKNFATSYENELDKHRLEHFLSFQIAKNEFQMLDIATKTEKLEEIVKYAEEYQVPKVE